MIANTRMSRPRAAWLMVLSGCGLAAANAMAAELQEVVVTAQKREQRVQDVPAVVDVISGEKAQIFNLSTLSQMANLVPGFVYAKAPQDIPGITFRGLGTQAGNQGFDSSIGYFIDGMFLGQQRLTGAPIFDAERIELIKGTQSTLLGKNTSLGAISVTTRAPGDTFGGYLQAGAELDHGGQFADGALDLPASERLKTRFALHYSDVDGWLKNLATGNDVPKDEGLAARASAVFTASEDASARLTYQYSRSQRLGSAAQITDAGLAGLGLGAGPPVQADTGDTKNAFTTAPGSRDGEDYHDLRAHLVNLTANAGLGGDLTLTSVSSYGKMTAFITDNFDFDRKDVSYFHYDEDYWQASQELRIASPESWRVSFIAGAFYFRSQWDQLFTQHWGIPDFPPASPLQGQLFNGPFDQDFRQRAETISGFGQITWHATDALRLNLGARYTDESKHVLYSRTAVAPLTLWNTVINAPFPQQDLRASDSFPSGTFSIQYDASSDVVLYASAARGGKSGGFGEFNTVPLDPALGRGNPQRDAAVQPERTNAFELGAKTTLLNGTLRLDVAGFVTEVFGLQQLLFTAEGLFVSSNDRAESRGVEGSTSWQVSDRLRFDGAFTYADAKDKRTGLQLVQAPKWSGNAGFSFAQPLGATYVFEMSTAVRYRGEKFNQIGEGFASAPITMIDASLRLTNSEQRWFLSLAGQNLTNRKTSDFAFAGPDPFLARVDSIAPLRTVKFLAGISF